MNSPDTRSRHTLRTLAAVATLVFLAACSSKEDRIESGLKKGAEFVRLSDWDKANIEVRNVLQIDPKNARAYFLAGKVSENQREIQRAYGQYTKALELDPAHAEAKVAMARLLLFTGDAAKARALAQDVLAGDAAHAGARSLQAALLLKEGKPDEAITQAEAILSGPVEDPSETAMLLAGLHIQRGAPDKALAVIEKALARQPKHLGLLQVAAQVAGAASVDGKADATKAAGFYKRAVAVASKNNELWFAWAGHHARRGEVDLAEQVLKDSVEAQPDDARRRQALLEFVASRRSIDVAEAAYRQAIADKPRDMSIRFGLARLYTNANRPGDAQRVLADIGSQSEDAASQAQAKAQLAAWRLAAGKKAEAEVLLAEMLKANPRDNAALLLRGRIHLQAGRAGDAIIDLRTVVRDQPANAEAVRLLAQAHRAAGEPQLGRDVLAEAVKAKAENAELRLLLAADMADSKEYKAALGELDALIKTTPKAPAAYELKARVQLVQKDAAGAERTLAQLKVQNPTQAVSYYRLGQFHAEFGRADAALREYDAGIRAVPADPLNYTAAIGLLTGLKRYDEANARVEARLKAEPANVLHHQLKGDVAMARGDLPAAEKAYAAIIAAAPGAAVGYVNVSRALAAQGSLDAALQVLKQGEQAAPAEISIPLARAEWLARGKRYDDAIALYDSLLAKHPDEDAVVNNLAYLLLEIKGDKASAERALGLASRYADSRNPSYLDSLGWAHYKLGQYDKAVPLLEKAVALSQTSPLLQMHLGKALVKSGNTERGRQFLQRAIDSKTDLPRIDEARAMLARG